MKKILLPVILAVSVLACSKTIPQQAQVQGLSFPKVQGESLEKKTVTLPDAVKGSEAVLLIGYQQKTQFDIDRWILGMLQADVQAKIVEVPTIAGMMPEMVQGFISNGMRKGIPEEDWKNVVTVFGDAEKIISVLGNERPQSTYVVLLDREGNIRWMHNRGYSAAHLLELKDEVRKLKTQR